MGLRIYIAVRHSQDPSRFYGNLWRNNLYPALRQLGHTLIESTVDLAPASRFMHVASNFTPEEQETRNRITEQIVGEIKQAHTAKPIDLVLTYFYNSHFSPAGFAEIRRLGIPTVNFYCNSVYQFELVAELAAAVDFAWHPERDAGERYRGAGANPVWVQMGADPEVYRPATNGARQNRACFIGGRYADRERLAAELIRREVPLDLYGAGWTRSSPPATRDAANGPALGNSPTYLGRKLRRPGSVAAYVAVAGQRIGRDGLLRGLTRIARQAKFRRDLRGLSPLLCQHAKGLAGDLSETFARYDVVLNFSNVWADGEPGSPLIPHVRLRDFEGPMSRTCYLTGHTEEIAECYDLGREIDTYRSPDELVEKTKYYLSHGDAAEKLREAGYRRALRDHTWRRRFEELFQKIGLA